MKKETILKWLQNEGEQISATIKIMCHMYIKDASYTFRICSELGGGSYCSVHNHDILIHVGIPAWFDSDCKGREKFVNVLGHEPNLADMEAFYKGLAMHEFMHACITRPGDIIDQIANRFPMRATGATKYEKNFYKVNIKNVIHHWFNCVCDARIENVGKNRYNIAQYFDFMNLVAYMANTDGTDSNAWEFGYALLNLGTVGRLPQYQLPQDMLDAINAIVESEVKGSQNTKDLLDEFICEQDPTISARKFAQWFNIPKVHDYVAKLLYEEVEVHSKAAEVLAKLLAEMPNEVQLSGSGAQSPIPLILPGVISSQKPLSGQQGVGGGGKSNQSSDPDDKDSEESDGSNGKGKSRKPKQSEEDQESGGSGSGSRSDQQKSEDDGQSSSGSDKKGQDQDKDSEKGSSNSDDQNQDQESGGSSGNRKDGEEKNQGDTEGVSESDGDADSDENSEDGDKDCTEEDSDGEDKAKKDSDGEGEPQSEEKSEDGDQSESDGNTDTSDRGNDEQDEKQSQEAHGGDSKGELEHSEQKGTDHHDTFDEKQDWSRCDQGGKKATQTDSLAKDDPEIRAALDNAINEIKKYATPVKKPKKQAIKSSSNNREKAKTISSAQLVVNTSHKPDRFAPQKVIQAAKPLRALLKRAFCQDQEDDIVGLKAGSLNTKALYRLKQSDLSIFKEHRLPTINTAAYYFLWDGSGSMCGFKQSESGSACAVLEEAVRGIYPLKIVNFCTDYGGVVHYLVRDFDDKSRFNAAYSFAAKRSFSGGNKDGFSIREAANELIRRHETNKFLIVLSDGAPSDYPSRKAAIDDVKGAVAFAREHNIDVTSIFFGTECERSNELSLYQEMYGRGNIIACEPDAIVSHLIAIVKKNIHKH